MLECTEVPNGSNLQLVIGGSFEMDYGVAGYGLKITDPGGKVVLTTGANSGIGLATVVRLATLGFHSVGTVRSDAKAATVTAAAMLPAFRLKRCCST